ncbi:MAG: multicopper oxidase family protein [Pyrinomonadaceae bacterium]|nr:multicopper oxidase family protein [Pyrinomonadaceae bacterium]
MPRKASEKNSGLGRRRFLTGGLSVIAAVVGPWEKAFPQSRKATSTAPSSFEPFTQPAVQISQNGTLRTNLRVVEADVSIRDVQGVRIEHTRCYNGSVPGPTLKLRAGEELRIKLSNELPSLSEHCGKEHLNRPHCFNTTNIHTHGLHVSPEAPSDNSFLRIEPQSDYQYCFQLPDMHPAGTFWYHAHVHGSTGVQSMNGMAGALIIEDPDKEKLVPESRDVVWMIQELMGKGAEKLYSCDHPHAPYTVNGKFQPTLNLRPGEVQRWRFINATATPGGYMDLQLLDRNNTRQEFMLIAIDGYPLRKRQRRTSYVLPPGGRVDFLVRLRRPGRYKMLKRRFQGQAQDQVLAWIDSVGKPLNTPLPRALSSLPPFLNPITDEEIVKRRIIRFQVCPDQARGDICKNYPSAKLCSGDKGHELLANVFLIDGKPYDPDRVDHSIRLGTAEEWEVVNETGAEHPFHIHINHFQVMRPGVAPEDWVWQDTVSLPADRSVKIRSRFLDYPGRFLLHCHILLHSDLGMMQNVEVVGDGKGPLGMV